ARRRRPSVSRSRNRARTGAAAPRRVLSRSADHRGVIVVDAMLDRSAAEIARDVNAGALSAAEVTEATLAHADAIDGRVGAYLTILHDLARQRAAAIDARVRAGERLPLAGVPMAVKDNMCLSGTRTTAGSKILEHWTAPYTATAVARM